MWPDDHVASDDDADDVSENDQDDENDDSEDDDRDNDVEDKDPSLCSEKAWFKMSPSGIPGTQPFHHCHHKSRVMLLRKSFNGGQNLNLDGCHENIHIWAGVNPSRRAHLHVVRVPDPLPQEMIS